jgi:nitrate/nitrite transporter NarK
LPLFQKDWENHWVLVGALVLGTAFPHLLKAITNTLPWQSVILSTLSAVVGGLMMLILVPNGLENKSRNPAVSFGGIFKNQNQALPFCYFITCGSYMLSGHLRR